MLAHVPTVSGSSVAWFVPATSGFVIVHAADDETVSETPTMTGATPGVGDVTSMAA
jgi:hypothetical protein